MIVNEHLRVPIRSLTVIEILVYMYVGLSKITRTFLIVFDNLIEFHSNLQCIYSHVICSGLQYFITFPLSVIKLQ